MNYLEIANLKDEDYVKVFKDKDSIDATFKKISLEIHPDRCSDPRAGEAMAVLSAMRQVAIRAATLGIWGVRRVVTIGGKKFAIVANFGDYNIGRNSVSIFVPDSQVKRVAASEKIVKGLKYHDAKMRTTFQICAPSTSVLHKVSGGFVHVVKTPDGMLRLKEATPAFEDAKHGSWVIRRLLSMCCWLQYNRVSLCSIREEAVWIHPKTRDVFVHDWLHAVSHGEPHLTAPSELVKHLTSQTRSKLPSTSLQDLEHVKRLARVLLNPSRTPDSLVEWSKGPSAGDPVRDFASFDAALEKAFGARRYSEMPITRIDAYGE